MVARRLFLIYIFLGLVTVCNAISPLESKLIEQVFGSKIRSIRTTVFLSDEQQDQLKKIDPTHNPDRLFSYNRLLQNNTVVGFAVIQKAFAKSGEFSVLAIVSSDLTLKKVVLHNYPFTHGYEISNSKFLTQFDLLKFADLNYGAKVNAVTGATSSSDGMLKAVKKVLIGLSSRFDK